MRICIITEYFPKSENFEVKGGVEAAAYNEAYQLAKKHEVIVLTSLEEGVPNEYELNGIKVIGCSRERSYVQTGSFKNRLSFMKDAYNQGKKLDIDLTIGYNFITYPVAWKISQKLKIPCVARYMDVWVGEWTNNIGISGVVGEVLERYVLSRKFDLIISISDYTRKKLERYFPPEKITVIPPIVNFPPVNAEKYSQTTISCVARLVEYKKVDNLIRAMHILIEDFPQLQCKIVGTGPKDHDLKNLVKKLNLENNIEFCGFVEKHEDVLKIIKSSHIFCLPSKVEGFGIVVVEALGCGVPFVASKIPPIMEASGEKGGLFFEPENWMELSEKIKYLLNNPQIYEKLQNEGADQYKKYEGVLITNQLEKLYIGLYEQQNKNKNA
ncbi:MAG: glycosyltransferase family 1 protein [Methanobacteriales archaeon HGW-Methanobacteriales-1]|jgi:glycosyltransferase involved in cell wall biosynthesis|nr:MAG: glycosyltransferase family 1 protein [Methanobacteriales archaeon HGW-Methanobacteriales-1]